MSAENQKRKSALHVRLNPEDAALDPSCPDTLASLGNLAADVKLRLVSEPDSPLRGRAELVTVSAERSKGQPVVEVVVGDDVSPDGWYDYAVMVLDQVRTDGGWRVNTRHE